MKNIFLGFVSLACLVMVNDSIFALPMVKKPDGAVKLVEYYDYECPHCRRMNPVIDALKMQYPNLEVTYRVTPLLTSASRGIASIALSEKYQSRDAWRKFHHDLMQFNNTLTIFDAWHIASELGAKPAVLTRMMKSQKVQNQINKNIKMVNRYAVNGGIYLPIFIFSGQSQLNEKNQSIVLIGEQPRTLLSAIIQQLSDQYVQVVKNKNSADRGK